MRDVSVIIVHRHGQKILLDCLKSLQHEKLKEILVVDNNSSDSSIVQAKKLAKTLKLPITFLHNSHNAGFAEANNQALALAKGKYVLFLNNDTIVNEGFLAPLTRVLEKHPTAAAVQPLIAFPNKTVDSIGSYFTPLGFLYHKLHRVPVNELREKESVVYSLKGACMLWKKEVLDIIGSFDTHFFAYFEETELCHRAINCGYTMHFSPNASITHLGGFTSNTMDQAFIQFHNTKNRFTTYLKHLPTPQLLSVLPVHFLLTEMLFLKSCCTSWKVAFAIQRGIILGIFRGLRERALFEQSHTLRKIQSDIVKIPDLSYYVALFSGLKGYRKVW